MNLHVLHEERVGETDRLIIIPSIIYSCRYRDNESD